MTSTALTRAVTAPANAARLTGLAREANAIFAIAWREVLRAVKSPASIAVSIIFPVLFIGLMGGSIGQNLGAAVPYPYLPFMIIGMIANSVYAGTIGGITTLVEERETNVTAELFVAPITRVAVLLGSLVGSAVASLASLVGILAMIVVMQVPMNAGDLLRVVALTPVLALAGGSLGVLFIGFVSDPKTAAVGGPLLVFPQMFLSGALIPMSSSSGILAVLSKLSPMTYSIDLARNIFYLGKPEYALTVLHPLWLDLGVTAALFVAFTAIGSYFFVRKDRGR